MGSVEEKAPESALKLALVSAEALALAWEQEKVEGWGLA